MTKRTLITATGVAVLGTLAVGFARPSASSAQDVQPDQSQPKLPAPAADSDNDLPAQIHELKAKVAALEAVLGKRYPGTADRNNMGGKGMDMMGGKGMDMMGGMKDMGEKGMVDDDDMTEMMKTMRTMMEMKMMQMKNKGVKGGMSDMPDMGMGGMSGKGMDMMGGKGMTMMGGMKLMGGMQSPSALPGFPGASHIYHIGATGFFLDHPRHIDLTSEQRTELGRVKEKALLDQATAERRIEQADQELWTLTASDEPDAAKIDAQVRAIEKLRGDQRLAFIRSVGEAAKVLTDEQRRALLGMEKPDAHQHPAPSAD